MGWMWSSSSSPSKGPNSTSSTSESTKSAPPAKQVESDYGDPEIAKFIAQIQAELSGSNSKPADQARPPPTPDSEKTASAPTDSSKSSSSWSFWGSSQPSSQPTTTSRITDALKASSSAAPPTATPSRLDPVSESLLPTTMSCREAFDAAYHCNSLGGQWMSVYRAGSVRSCSEKWDDFWFCMRTRTYASPQKEDAIREYYRNKEWTKYHAPGRPSSVDVWEPRREKVEPGTEFPGGFDMPNVSDEEWRILEIENRRRVQENLSREKS